MAYLYYFPGDAASERAYDIAQECQEVKCVDISRNRKLPRFVDGVPLLTEDHEEFRGTNCLKRLQRIAESGSELGGFCPDEASAVDVSGRFSGKKEFLKGSVSGDSLARYMQARQTEIAGFNGRRRK